MHLKFLWRCLIARTFNERAIIHDDEEEAVIVCFFDEKIASKIAMTAARVAEQQERLNRH